MTCLDGSNNAVQKAPSIHCGISIESQLLASELNKPPKMDSFIVGGWNPIHNIKVKEDDQGCFIFLDETEVVSEDSLEPLARELWDLVTLPQSRRAPLPEEMTAKFFSAYLDIRLTKACMSKAFCLRMPELTRDTIATK